jgi:hypothetical protein
MSILNTVKPVPRSLFTPSRRKQRRGNGWPGLCSNFIPGLVALDRVLGAFLAGVGFFPDLPLARSPLVSALWRGIGRFCGGSLLCRGGNSRNEWFGVSVEALEGFPNPGHGFVAVLELPHGFQVSAESGDGPPLLPAEDART